MPLLLGHHQLLLLLLVSVAAPHVVDSADDTHDSSMCLNQSYTCGSLVISYPFYLSGETRDLKGYANSYCGYPGMGVFCDDGKPFLQLDGTANYTFMSIDYASATVSLVDPEVVDSSCPRVDHNVTFARGSWLDFPPGRVDYLVFFLGCYFNSSLVQQPSDIGPITCQGFDHSSFVIPDDGVPPGNWSQACRQVVQAPVLKHGPVDPKDVGWTNGGYSRVLSQGFQVSWGNEKPTPCLQCERSNGRCSYNQTGEFIGCFCSNGRLTDKDCGNFTPGHKNSNLLKVVLPIIACLLILACIAFVRIWKYKASKRQKKEMHKRLVLGYLNASNETRGENVEFSFFSFEDIAAATDNFSISKQIGRGGFGKVYKGKLKGVNEVAIKRLSKDSGQGIDEFKNEIALIAKLQHRNLVRLLGCCIHEDERLLVYEYLPNKSLDGFLFDATKQYVLDWHTRFEIVKGVARGLLYLHQDSRLTIIHRDLKASNILLDSEMTPKISDFGMARIFYRNQHHANTNRVVGTYGYMSPEYVMGGAFSVKSDTYSFGVLLLEIVSGLKISSPQLIMKFVSLTTYAWRLWEDGKAIELVDSSVIEKCPLHEVLRCIHVGLLCVQDRPDDRPLVSSVIFMLENGGALLPAPKQPAYSAIPVCETEQLGENMENSVNEVSITTLEGR